MVSRELKAGMGWFLPFSNEDEVFASNHQHCFLSETSCPDTYHHVKGLDMRINDRETYVYWQFFAVLP